MKIENNKITTTVKKTEVSEGSETTAFLSADIHN